MFDLEHEQQADYRIIELSGSPAAIADSMARQLRHLPSPLRKWPWEDDGAFMSGCASILRETAPWLWDELATFAERLHMPPERGLFVRAGSLSHGCSAVAWRASDGHVYAGRTYDFYVRIRTRHLLLTRPDTGYAHAGMNGGLAGGRYDGVNEHGVFVALHKVMADRPAELRPGVPYHLLPRLALQTCRTAKEAAELIEQLPQLASFNYTLADASGTLIGLECYPGRPVQRREAGTVLAVTNHYTHPALVPLQGQRSTVDSRRRQAALEAVVLRDGNPWQATLAAVADHDGGVCCHREFGATLWAGVFDLSTPAAAYSFGAPCRNKLRTVELPALAAGSV